MQSTSVQCPIRWGSRFGCPWRVCVIGWVLAWGFGLGCDRAASRDASDSGAESPPAVRLSVLASEDSVSGTRSLGDEAGDEETIRGSLAGGFRPPPVGVAYTVHLPGGGSRTGMLRALSAGEVRMDFGGIELTYPRAALEMRTRAELFEADHRQAQTLQRIQDAPASEAGMAEAQQLSAQYEHAGESPARPPAVGEAPDRLVHQGVWKHLQETLMDPDSIAILSWSPVMAVADGYRIVCVYRARAGSFGMVTERKVFHLDRDGRVTAVAAVRWDPARDPE